MVEKVTGMPFQDALTRGIWRRLGAEAGYFKDAAHREVEPLPVLREVLEGVFGSRQTNAPRRRPNYQ